MFVKRKVLHVDGKTTVIARGLIKDGVFTGEYRFNNFDWGVEMPDKKLFKVITVLNKDATLFIGEQWECYEFIEKRYGNGLAAILCLVSPNN